MENDINGSYFLFTLYFKEARVACVLRDNARPPCKAWKWEEREKGSVAAPASPPGANTETRDGKGGWWYGGSARKGKVKTMKEERGS